MSTATKADYNIEKVSLNKICPNCGKPLYGTYIMGNLIPFTCACELEKAAQEEKDRKEYERKKKIKMNRYYSGFPKKQEKQRFENFEQRAECDRLYRTCKKYVEMFSEMKKGLLLIGSCGAGKTHLACAIGNELLDRGYTVRFCRATDIFERLRGSYSGSEESEYDIISEYKNCRLLIIDDVGVTAPSEWSKAILQSLIDDRINNERPTIMTTNLSQEELGKKLDARTMDRITEGFYVVTTQAKSYRQELGTWS